MASTSHASNFRPLYLDDVLGQPRHVKSLKYFLKNNQIPPVILVSGKSGTGKTTTARIIAAAAMCPKFDPETVRGCGECVDCRSAQGINDGPNFMHLDGAGSNLKDVVENDLKMFLYSSPVKARYKVCIADEAQALSSGAKNSLLTLAENLPKTGLIIMTTTDPEAIDAAILTRSLKYHFAPIPPEQMVDGVLNVRPDIAELAAREGLLMLAEFADGSMREFWQLIQQFESYEEELTPDLAAEIVGGAKASARGLLWQRVESGDLVGIQKAWKAMINNGANPQRLGVQLMTDVYAMSAEKPLERDWTDVIRLLSQAQVYKEELGYLSALMSIAKSPAEQVASLTVEDLTERIVDRLKPDLEKLAKPVSSTNWPAVPTHSEADRPKEKLAEPHPVKQERMAQPIEPAIDPEEVLKQDLIGKGVVMTPELEADIEEGKALLGHSRKPVDGSVNEALAQEAERRAEIENHCNAVADRVEQAVTQAAEDVEARMLEAQNQSLEIARERLGADVVEALEQAAAEHDVKSISVLPDVDELVLPGDVVDESTPPWEHETIDLNNPREVYQFMFGLSEVS